MWLAHLLMLEWKDIILSRHMLVILVSTLIWNNPPIYARLILFHCILCALCQHYLEPPVKLNEALGRYGLKTEDFFVLKHGESRYLHTDDENSEWMWARELLVKKVSSKLLGKT